MDHANYHVVYVDARIGADLDGKHLQKSASNPSDKTAGSEDTAWEQANADCLKAIINEVEDVRNNVKRLLRQFNGGMLAPWGRALVFASVVFQHRAYSCNERISC